MLHTGTELLRDTDGSRVPETQEEVLDSLGLAAFPFSLVSKPCQDISYWCDTREPGRYETCRAQ